MKVKCNKCVRVYKLYPELRASNKMIRAQSSICNRGAICDILDTENMLKGCFVKGPVHTVCF